MEAQSGCGPYELTVIGPLQPRRGACCDDETSSCTDDVIEAECGARFAADVLCADLLPACGDLDPCADGTILAPGSWSGTTCGGFDDCSLRAGADRTIQVTIPTNGNWIFLLCGGSPVWDTYMFLGSDCCASSWYDDDGCDTVLSRVQRPALAAGTYYVDIEPYSASNCNEVTLEVVTYQPERTAAPAPPGPSRLEQSRER